jgi:hypothetical protein
VIDGKENNPKISSQLIVYTLATTFSINPLEVYAMPASLVMDMLAIHYQIKQIEAEELAKMEKKM